MYSTRKAPPVKLDLDYIRNYVSDLEIYEYYSGQKMKIGQTIKSPLRDDKNPSWSLFKVSPDIVLWKDFSTGESGNAITFVKILTGSTYNEALKKVWRDLASIKLGKPRMKKPKSTLFELASLAEKKTEIKIKRQGLTKTDEDYWGRFGITRDILKKYNVFPISAYWINDIQQPIAYTKENPMYAYKVFTGFKIYRPLEKNKSKKWKSNLTTMELQGFEQLPPTADNLIITKSLKDVMTLYALGYTAVAPQCETSRIPEPIMKHLKERFKNIVIFYDNDEAGIKGAKRIAERHDLPYNYIPQDTNVKDISEFVEEYGPDSARDFIDNNILSNVKTTPKQEDKECN